MGIQVINFAKTIQITDATGLQNIAIITKSSITSVGMYYQNNTVNAMGFSGMAYGKRTPNRNTKTIIRLHLQDETQYNFDCDEVLNQVGWQGCTQAALYQAIADINSWLQ